MLEAKIVGAILRDDRRKKGVSQECLSGLADIGRTHLSMIERGTRKPTLDTLCKIADALDVRASELIRMMEEEQALLQQS